MQVVVLPLAWMRADEQRSCLVLVLLYFLLLVASELVTGDVVFALCGDQTGVGPDGS